MKRNGFTLIELLVVMAIISILVFLTVSQFQTAKRKANDVARKGDLNSLTKALQLYYTDYGYFPTSSSDGKLIVSGSTLSWGGAFEDTTVNPAYVYMKVLPRENFLTSYPYCYKAEAVANPKKYALFAKLENTTDSQCKGNYTCGGVSGYCYATTSPNTVLDTNGALQ